MDLIEYLNKFIRKILGKDNESSFEKICEERNSLKSEIRQSLKEINFTDLEIKEVLLIVDNTEKKIDTYKAKLVGSNIGMDSPLPLMEYVQGQIAKATQQMQIDLRNKVQEIIARRNS
ncbi:MAG: hypothetical protein A2287_10095 [Candidatus Melainabacteria bacterium RIFOXYA12_FULL_32_12]|nr:MAG: hypothetical protein A2255_06545 [Candidatus Melainabacteria bacterium RIFOXYA2_FULL_32_9]OGI26008.1 MAG: hypothetical protein A2287_10095 [Candidatus Melainabacteria bacterium RIFOXYA12_FULL_32_12]